MPDRATHDPDILKFAKRLALVLVFVSALPSLVAWLTVPTGSLYVGSAFNTDDHMVYAAWMKQAMEGRFLFENRFTTDAQPGLTIHLYFWVLGTIARLFGFMGPEVALPVVAAVARLVFTYLFVVQAGKLVNQLKLSVFASKFGLILMVFGAGLGFASWQAFGRLAEGAIFSDGRLPIDVWQPEAFVFPSALTNGLFMVSLFLIVTIFSAVLKAKDGWSSVPIGAFAMLVLMNIHSYDVLLVALVLVAFLVTIVASKSWQTAWVVRSLAIGAGALPAAAWFLYVLGQDKVFQARAATLTYSPTFKQVVAGIGLLLLAALAGAMLEKDKRKLAGAGLLAGLIAILYIGGTGYDPDAVYYLDMAKWAVCYLVALAGLGLMAGPEIGRNLLWSWAMTGLIAPYVPQLFQRKLAMGLVIPWAFLAAIGVEAICRKFIKSTSEAEADPRNVRNLASAVVAVVAGATSVFWFQREILLIRNDVSTTKVQPVFFSSDVTKIIAWLGKAEGSKVVIARPGAANNDPNDPYASPYLPDINPLLTGLAGATTFAGHWSETPDYMNRRMLTERLYQDPDPESRKEILRSTGADYVVVPDAGVFNALPSVDLSDIGETVYSGRQLRLLKVDKDRL